MVKPKISAIIPVGPNRDVEVLEGIKRQKNPIQIIVKSGKNPSKNRNEGIAEAKGEVIAFLDAHSILPDDWSEKVISFFNSNPQTDILGGPQLTPKNQNFFGRASGYALSSVFGSASVSNRYQPGKIKNQADETYFSSANLACRSKVTKKIKFDESLYPGEDPKFIESAIKAGFKTAYVPNIYVYHRRRNSLGDFLTQIFKYGVTRPLKEGPLNTLRHPQFIVPSAFILYLVLLPILSIISWIFMVPLFVYVLLSAIFSIYEGLSNKDFLSILIMPLIFFGLHISYGLGFFYGLVRRYI